MGFGEVCAGTHQRLHLKLEADGTDSSGNGNNLTSSNISYIPAKFKNGANYPIGTNNRRLQSAIAVFTSNTITQATFVIWFKLNNTTSSNVSARIFETGANEPDFQLVYTISGGIMTISGIIGLSTTNGATNFTMTPDTNWHCLIMVKNSATVSLYLDGVFKNSNTGSGSTTHVNPGNRTVSIGTNATLTGTIQIYADIDNVVLEETAWSAEKIKKYYTQAKGRFAI